MVESQRERQLFLMILNIGSAMAAIQEALLGLSDSPVFEDSKKQEVLQHNAAIATQLNDLMTKARAYQNQ